MCQGWELLLRRMCYVRTIPLLRQCHEGIWFPKLCCLQSALPVRRTEALVLLKIKLFFKDTFESKKPARNHMKVTLVSFHEYGKQRNCAQVCLFTGLVFYDRLPRLEYSSKRNLLCPDKLYCTRRNIYIRMGKFMGILGIA